MSLVFLCAYLYLQHKNNRNFEVQKHQKNLDIITKKNNEVIEQQKKLIDLLQQETNLLQQELEQAKNSYLSLEKKWEKLSEKSALSNKYIWDVVTSNTDVLEHFLQEIPKKIDFIRKEFTLLQEYSANRGILTNLDVQIQQIKNHSCLLKLTDIENRCKKIETLSNIVKAKTGEIRLERLVEMESHFMQLVESLEVYEKVGSKYLEQLQKKQKNKLSVSGQRLSNIENHFQVLQRMIFSGNINSAELNSFLNTTNKALSHALDIPSLKDKIIFEFGDFFEQILRMYSLKINNRNIRWRLVHEVPRILLHCDYVKINKQLSLFLYMSLMLAEKDSNVLIESNVVASSQNCDILKLKTRVAQTNKSQKAKDAIKKLFREYQKISRNSLAELEITKKGLCFRFPGVINKKFKQKLSIAIFGSVCEELSQKLTNCEKFFPFDFEIVLNPTNCYNTDIAIADSKVLETLGNHIYKQLQGGAHLIPLLIPIEKNEEDPIAFAGEYYYLHLPVRSMELRWLIFQCLDYILSQEKAQQIGKTIMFQRPSKK